MDLNSLWFILVAILFSGYFFLEGFDFGVGILLPFISKKDIERRIIINTIGPHWDGNEVWLVAAAGATFAAFPEWYATLLSGFYMPFFFLLMALIVRGVAFEFRSKENSTLWRSFWDWSICIGSLIPAFLWGMVFSNLVFGIPINSSYQFTGIFLDLVNLPAILGGMITSLGFTLHGALFLNIKTSQILIEKSRVAASKLWFPLIACLIIYTILGVLRTDIFTRFHAASFICAIITLLSTLAIGITIRYNNGKYAFILSSVAVLCASATIFLGLYPYLMISNLNPEWSLNIYNAASNPYTLRVMSIAVAIFFPIALAFQAWSYWIFRKRLSMSNESLEY